MAARSFIPDFHWTTNWFQLCRLDFEELLGSCLSPDLAKGSRVDPTLDNERSRDFFLEVFLSSVQGGHPVELAVARWLLANGSRRTASSRASLSAICVLRSTEQQTSWSNPVLTTSTFVCLSYNENVLYLTVTVPQVCRARYSHVCLASRWILNCYFGGCATDGVCLSLASQLLHELS